MTLTNSVVSGNTVTNGRGGGIMNTGYAEHLSRVTVSNNTADGNGGGIFALGLTYVSQSGIIGNTAGGDGGAMFSENGQQLDQSLIAGNKAVHGAGIYNAWVVQLTNDTLAGNTASGTGNAGGALYDSVLFNSGSAQVTNVTISGNRSDDGGGIFDGSGGGIAVHNTIIAGNKMNSGTTDTNCDISNGAPLTDNGNNLDSGHTCGLTGPGDKQNTNPKLGALANNGGPTRTMALLTGSPAINAGSQPAPSVDQRGVHRDSRPDMGAYEKH
jgi:predicted outer membrane repeat protein